MKISYKKTFIKSFKKLKKNEQFRVKEIISLFQKDIFNPSLNNHALQGKYKDYRSINAGGDLRLIFREKNNYFEILFLDLGTHSKLY